MPVGEVLGPYRILSKVGEGGMGEVYRARDTRLAREVAIKVLPEAFAANPDRLRRFEQEARTAGALNHPNVLVVHDVGEYGGSPYLVTELLEGATLRAALAAGPLPLRKALDYALQTARGLAAAHERGIVHRDLKPENLFVTHDGRVKILDFGLAKLVEPSAAPDPLESLTRTGLTAPGVVVGTVGYMSPEQVSGQPIDHRTDIFSLGAILYEVLSGERPFRRDSALETLHAVLKDDVPDIAASSTVAPALNRILRSCLEKRPDQRFHSARDVAVALEAVASLLSGNASLPAPAIRRPRWRAKLPWAAATLLLAVAATSAFLYSRRAEPAGPVVRFEILPPERGMFPAAGTYGLSAVLAPDGHALALVVIVEGRRQLVIRRLDSPIQQVLSETEDAANPFWSPDSRWIAFVAGGALKKVAAAGGSPQTICRMAGATSGTWGADDVIVFSAGARGNFRVSASGGEPEALGTWGQHERAFWPAFLPDGRHFVYLHLNLPATSQGASEGPPRSELRIGAVNPNTTPTPLMQVDSRAVYASPGYLLFVREGSLQAQPFDVSRLRLTGGPVTIAENVMYFQPIGSAVFSASDTGILAYQSAPGASTLVWHTRDGSEAGTVGRSAHYWQGFRLSPDGQRLAAAVADPRSGTTDLWLFDLPRSREQRFTFDPGVEWLPAWSPDGQQVAFSADRPDAPPFLHVRRVGDVGSGGPLIAPSMRPQQLWDWTRTAAGEFLIYSDGTPETGDDLFVLPLSGERKPWVFANTAFDESDARFSPDGKWVAYVSTVSGRSEVYVRRFEQSSRTEQISTAGGSRPRWNPNGEELFYVAADGRLMAVGVHETTGLETVPPRALFTINAQLNQYEVGPDGQRFLVQKRLGPPWPTIVAVNWQRGLRR